MTRRSPSTALPVSRPERTVLSGNSPYNKFKAGEGPLC